MAYKGKREVSLTGYGVCFSCARSIQLDDRSHTLVRSNRHVTRSAGTSVHLCLLIMCSISLILSFISFAALGWIWCATPHEVDSRQIEQLKREVIQKCLGLIAKHLGDNDALLDDILEIQESETDIEHSQDNQQQEQEQQQQQQQDTTGRLNRPKRSRGNGKSTRKSKRPNTSGTANRSTHSTAKPQKKCHSQRRFNSPYHVTLEGNSSKISRQVNNSIKGGKNRQTHEYGPWEVADWLKESKNFNLTPDKYGVVVLKSGLYYLYSQILFHNAAAKSSYSVVIDATNVTLLKCFSSVNEAQSNDTSENERYSTCHTGAIVKLDANQTLKVKMNNPRKVDLQYKANFFGIFRIASSGQKNSSRSY